MTVEILESRNSLVVVKTLGTVTLGNDLWLAFAHAQTLTALQRTRALSNLGIEITNDEIRVTCPDTTVRRALLSDLS